MGPSIPWRTAICVAALVTSSCGSESAARQGASGSDSTEGNATVISVVAQRWMYTPSKITLKKGVPVVFEITSTDVHHGFNLPQFNLRADALPGQKSHLAFTPTETGTFTFRCDVFCGDGHEDMGGKIHVA